LNGDDNIGDAVHLEQFDDMRHHHAIDQRNHRLGSVDGQGAQTRAFATGHDDSFHRRGSSCCYYRPHWLATRADEGKVQYSMAEVALTMK
jgi:hypothetical protein